jgi:ubiquinone/menaquinone biosynthesis C-methylase UbiE
VTFVASTYDRIAPNFDRQRALPGDVVLSVRAAVLNVLGHTPVPRILDLGAGSGRIGQVFVTAGDDYVGVDLAVGMLQTFAGKETGERRAVLIQADGRTLPFTDASFDAVLLVAVFGDLPDWHPLIAETRRVLRPHGVVVIGHTATPDDGIDERLKQRLDLLLDKRMPRASRKNGRKSAAQYLAEIASGVTDLVPASWPVHRNVRQFLERHSSGARFSRLPLTVRKEALAELAVWAEAQFGTLDAGFAETHWFEMQVFRFGEG